MESLYYSLVKNESTKSADIYIFGDITSYDYPESNMSAFKLSKILNEMNDLKTINVHISSYGGEVKEGLAIYNVLKNHKAKVITYNDGFACSIASVIFMAGDERIMSKSSLLMIHNAWVFTSGNANDLRKEADDLDKITSASIMVYLESVNLTEEELKKMMDEEYWLDYNEALKFGFATKVQNDSNKKASQSVKNKLINLILEKYNQKAKEVAMKKYKCSKCDYIYEGEDLPEYFVCPECGAEKDSFEEITDEDDVPEEKVVGYKCSKCDYIYEGEDLPEYFVCPECGAGKDSFEEITEEEKTKNKSEATEAVAFFNAMIGGMK